MNILIAGVALFAAVHFVPILAPGLRNSLKSKMGNAYKGLFALSIVAAIGLIIFGWRDLDWELIYTPPTWGKHLSAVLMLGAIMLFGAGKRAGHIRKAIRHPMLTGVAVWSVAHLLANGEDRSVVLFGGMGLWALVSMVLINKRDGAWTKYTEAHLRNDFKSMAIAIVIFLVILTLHPLFTDVAPYSPLLDFF